MAIRNGDFSKENGVFYDLRKGNDSGEKQEMLFQNKNMYISNSVKMQKLPNSVIAYWCSDNLIKAFSEYSQIRDAFSLECGIKNGSNEKFLRAWFEISDIKTNKSKNRDICLKNMD